MIASIAYAYNTNGAAHAFKITVVMLGAGMKTLTHTLQPGWNMVSAPVEPVATSALDQLGDDLNMFNVYQYFNGRFYTARDAEGVDIQAGSGYWIYVDGNTEIDLVGMSTDPAAGVKVPLKPGWNLVGNPFEQPLAWGDPVRFTCGGETKTLSGAVTAGWTDGAMYDYAGSGAYTKITPGGSLAPWRGYWLKISRDCEIDFRNQ
jgi:hypothetical protein